MEVLPDLPVCYGSRYELQQDVRRAGVAVDDSGREGESVKKTSVKTTVDPAARERLAARELLPPGKSGRGAEPVGAFGRTARHLTAGLAFVFFALVALAAPEDARAAKTVTLSTASTTIAEGDSGKKDVTINFTLGEGTPFTLDFLVRVVAASSTATDNTNRGRTSCSAPSTNADICYITIFSEAYAPISFGRNGSFKIGILGDTIDEGDGETVAIMLEPSDRASRDGWTQNSNTLILTITDDDEPAPAGVTISDTSLTVAEGSSNTYTVALDSAPSADVTITVGGESGEVTVTGSPLTFTSSDYSTAQTVTVNAGADPDTTNDSATLTHTASSSDTSYGSSLSIDSVQVTVTDTTTAPSAPTGLATAAGDAQVTLSWADPGDASITGYDVSYGPTGARDSAGWIPISGSDASTTRYTVTSLDNDAEYSFQVLATNVAGDGDASAWVTATPTAPDDGGSNGGDGDNGSGGGDDGSGDAGDDGGDGDNGDDGSGDDGNDGGDGDNGDDGSGGGNDGDDGNDGSDGGDPGGGSGGNGGGTGGGGSGDDDDDSGNDGSDGDDDDAGDDSDDDVPPAVPPTASFTLSASCADGLCRARTGAAVSFTDTSTGTVASRTWSFGDGGTGSSGRSPRHIWSAPGFYTVLLTVSGEGSTSTTSRKVLVESGDPAGSCTVDGDTRCLRESRFSVAVEWWTQQGAAQTAGRVVHEGTDDSGLFWFFSEANWELLLKVLDGCSLNGHVWVFGASATTLGYSIRVTDTVTGAMKEYRNEPGKRSSAITDVAAFPDACTGSASAAVSSASAPPAGGDPVAALLPVVTVRSAAESGDCTPAAGTLCLQDGRYAVSVDWTNREGDTGKGSVAPPRADDSGLFWFFSETNWELLVKVLDACTSNGHHWVFAASATDVGFDLQVRDTVTGQVKRYTHTAGAPARALADVTAFPDACTP